MEPDGDPVTTELDCGHVINISPNWRTSGIILMKLGFTLSSSQQNEKREIRQLVNEAITQKITHKHGCG